MEINTRNLIENLPSFYREADTYKVANKGLLERFLRICGDYITDNILPDIESILDNIDVDKAGDEYLNQLWEFMGSLNYAYPHKYKPDVYKSLHNKLDSAEEYLKKEVTWTTDVGDDEPVTLTGDQIRNVLRYAIQLLHIRGSKKFFEILFRLYDIPVIITPKSYTQYNVSLTDTFYAVGDRDDDYYLPTKADLDFKYDDDTLDNTIDEFACSDVIFIIGPIN